MSFDWIDHELAGIAAADLLREANSRDGKVGAEITIDGEQFVSFAANDYLGLAADARVIDAARQAIQAGGWGSGSSPLIVGRSTIHAELERQLAAFVQREAALLFPTGFAANAGTIPALVGKGDTVFSDAKNHASIIDGCRLAGARIAIYPHADLAALERLLEEATTGRKLIVTDGLFSMDGDTAPTKELARLAEKFGTMLMVDEAHALGVVGPEGRGVCSEHEVASSLLVGTLSKSFGSHGGFVAGSRTTIEYLRNRARSYVFSTAAPVAAAAAALSALAIMREEPQRRTGLLTMAQELRRQLAERGWRLGPSEHHIIQLLLGEPAKAIVMSRRLRDAGFWVPCIRPPTVPPGESCLRISLASDHTSEMLWRLIGELGTE